MSQSEDDLRGSFTAWIDSNLLKGQADVPARLVTVMALFERLRHEPRLLEAAHLAPSGQQLIKHNQHVKLALKRFNVESPVEAYGRRASFLRAWMDPLFVWLKERQFESCSLTEREAILETIGSQAAARLKVFNEGQPLIARYSKGTPVAVVRDILDQAQSKKRAKDVAEYLVGAKLQLRFGREAVTPKNVNSPNRNELSDFRVGNAAIEVTVNKADESHIRQIERILADTGLQVWLLVRKADRERWDKAIEKKFGEKSKVVAVIDIESFVGQNTAELGSFGREEVVNQMVELFNRYNTEWLPRQGSSGIIIDSREPDAVPSSPT